MIQIAQVWSTSIWSLLSKQIPLLENKVVLNFIKWKQYCTIIRFGGFGAYSILENAHIRIKKHFLISRLLNHSLSEIVNHQVETKTERHNCDKKFTVQFRLYDRESGVDKNGGDESFLTSWQMIGKCSIFKNKDSSS